MSNPDGEYDALTRTERDRLEQFAAAFESLHPADYDLYVGARPDDDGVAAARAAAIEALGSSARREAAKRAMGRFSEEAQRAIARSMPVPEVWLTPRPGGTWRDRVLLLESLQRAVIAVILWDELQDHDIAALAGPWLALIQRSLGEEPLPVEPRS